MSLATPRYTGCCKKEPAFLIISINRIKTCQQSYIQYIVFVSKLSVIEAQDVSVKCSLRDVIRDVANHLLQAAIDVGRISVDFNQKPVNRKYAST